MGEREGEIGLLRGQARLPLLGRTWVGCLAVAALTLPSNHVMFFGKGHSCFFFSLSLSPSPTLSLPSPSFSVW